MSRSMLDGLRLRPRRHALWLSPVAQPGALLPADFESWCRDHAGASVTLWWAAAGLQLLDIAPDLPLTDAQRPGYARGVFAHYAGRAADSAALALWRSGKRFGACLAPGLDLATLRAVARRHRVRLQRVAPLWVARLEQTLQAWPEGRREAHAVVLALEADWLVALALERGRLQSVRLLRLDAATPAALDEARQGLGWPGPVLMLGHGLALGPAPAGVGQGCQVLGTLQAGEPDLQAPQRAVLDSPPDFAAPAMPRSQRLGWWAAAVGSALFMAGGWDAWLSYDERAQAQAREQVLQQRLAALQRPAARPLVVASTPRTWPPALKHPWGELLASVELASDAEVHWLLLEHSADRPALRLAGVAGDMAALMRVSERLSARAGWRDALPARLQTLPAVAPRPVLPGSSGVPVARGAVPTTGLNFELTALYLPGTGPQGGAP
ncbi:hypothetical protein BurJ1DRAFT_0914 [Burkholderiales bacterium JOSHI_001]|nr:hypothetical protein BurJ1DRAFT_0914 [Burkholderiales bacterium JOSHI_001]